MDALRLGLPRGFNIPSLPEGSLLNSPMRLFLASGELLNLNALRWFTGLRAVHAPARRLAARLPEGWLRDSPIPGMWRGCLGAPVIWVAAVSTPVTSAAGRLHSCRPAGRLRLQALLCSEHASHALHQPSTGCLTSLAGLLLSFTLNEFSVSAPKHTDSEALDPSVRPG